MSSNSFRDYLLPADAPRILAARNVDVATYGARMLGTEKARDLQAQWQASLDETFRGITTDGRVREGLFALADEGFAVDEAVAAARELLRTLEPSQRQRVCQPIDAPQWRAWYNPEIPFNDYGVRLEATSPATREAFLGLLRTCTSEQGFRKVSRLMDANHFLGELYDLNNIMNRWSFHFMFFGEPSADRP